MKPVLEGGLQGPELWRRQCARNLMDCYGLGMEAISRSWERGVAAPKALESLTRLMVDGMTAVKDADDERSFYRAAAVLCRECAHVGGEKAGVFRIYAALFEDMGGREG